MMNDVWPYGVMNDDDASLCGVKYSNESKISSSER